MSESAPTSIRSRALIERLVGFNTVSRESNLALIGFIHSYLESHGVECELHFNEERNKASLFATIGPRDRGGIVLSGHTDVVPADGQRWTRQAFQLTEEDGRLYGRGTTDMKSFIAAVLSFVPDFVRMDLRIPVHLAFSYDEEIGCLGVRPLLAAIGSRAVKPIACVIGEPTEMRVVSGHKGKLAMRCQVHGSEGHSAYAPYGVNAIEYAAKLVTRLAQIGERLATAEINPRFDPPFNTLQTGVISGGRALNMIPGDCHFDFEVRALPLFDPQCVADEICDYAERELLPEMRKKSAASDISFNLLSSYPGLDSADDLPIVRLLKLITGAQHAETVSYGTEGGLFTAADIPTVVCGPGSMAQGHQPDEFITVTQVAACEKFLQQLVEMLCKTDANNLFDSSDK
ncbi:acetylornithine deacetylase [Noviherbaspirillum saxi]|uniref:Acetylornithine deacetylase n=1 Tax=Noviherbaspirillum saxi TaxID=2320863 RepID=A0A3A3FKE2_9BURK|nr:acetylornithine deacetylase [Noviherbaspirillum saxi]RJF91805.1 acetylornithine deacetylase [Noviherbaspirillum saxi]